MTRLIPDELKESWEISFSAMSVECKITHLNPQFCQMKKNTEILVKAEGKSRAVQLRGGFLRHWKVAFPYFCCHSREVFSVSGHSRIWSLSEVAGNTFVAVFPFLSCLRK